MRRLAAALAMALACGPTAAEDPDLRGLDTPRDGFAAPDIPDAIELDPERIPPVPSPDGADEDGSEAPSEGEASTGDDPGLDLEGTDGSISVNPGPDDVADPPAEAPREAPARPRPPPYRPSSGSLMGRPLPAPAAPEGGDGSAGPEAKGDIEPGEVVVVHPDMERARAFARRVRPQGYGIERRRALKALGLVVTVLRVPEGERVGPALGRLSERFPGQALDANHRYRPLEAAAGRRYAAELIGWAEGPGDCAGPARIGLVDSGVDTDHPALRGRPVEQRSFLPAGVPSADTAHGTAIAGILAGAPDFGGLAGDASLRVAGVLRGDPERGADTSAERVAYGLDWVAGQGAGVVNLSLGGPRNRLLELAVQRLLARGVAVVAAAGHTGQEGAPMYPAAQDGVVAVTAIDAGLEVYPRATRGDYIDLAAPGVDVWTAASGGGGAYHSGTSYAAAYATGVLARAGGAEGARRLVDTARDLGEPGRDAVFGAGLIQVDGLCDSRPDD